jgi:hypothetical protein
VLEPGLTTSIVDSTFSENSWKGKHTSIRSSSKIGISTRKEYGAVIELDFRDLEIFIEFIQHYNTPHLQYLKHLNFHSKVVNDQLVAKMFDPNFWILH